MSRFRQRLDSTPAPDDAGPPEKNDFIRQIIREDLATGRHHSVRTRFPPEPNGYLHTGHTKSIVLNFGIGREFHSADGRTSPLYLTRAGKKIGDDVLKSQGSGHRPRGRRSDP